MGGLHSGETGPSEMLMELVYRLATETSPLIKQIRENVIVSITPAAEPDGRDRTIDWFYQNLAPTPAATPPAATAAAPAGDAGRGGTGRPRRGSGSGARDAADGRYAGYCSCRRGRCGGRWRTWRRGGAVLGQVRLPRQQPRH